MKKSRKNTLRGAGRIWTGGHGEWTTQINERITVLTWPFADKHQCKVLVKYNGDEVGIGLMIQPTILEAMKRGVRWVEDYIKNGVPSIEQLFKDCYTHWPTLYKNRVDIIEHLFFVIGNGYEWLDGAIICDSPDSYLESIKDEEERKKNPRPEDVKRRELFKKIIEDEFTPENKKKELQYFLDEEDGLITYERPLPDEGEPRVFYPVSKNYSAITQVPDDVRPEWLALAYEAAKLLRDRSGIPDRIRAKYSQEYIKDREYTCTSNIKMGYRLVKELEERFPQLNS